MIFFSHGLGVRSFFSFILRNYISLGKFAVFHNIYGVISLQCFISIVYMLFCGMYLWMNEILTNKVGFLNFIRDIKLMRKFNSGS